MKKKKDLVFYLIIVAAIFLALAVGGVLFFVSPSQKLKRIMDNGDRCLAEEDYPEAVGYYKAAIDLNPKNADAYIGLAEAYVGYYKYDKALNALEKGYDRTSDKRILDLVDDYRKEYDEYLEEEDEDDSDSGSSSEDGNIETEDDSEEEASTDASEETTQEVEEEIVDITTDLMAFLSADGQNVLNAFPAAHKEGNGGDAYYQVDGEMDDYAIAGPFFYLNNNGFVNEIYYSGVNYSIGGIYKGMSVPKAINILENDGWEFSDVDYTHGTGTYNVTLTKKNMVFFIDTDQDGDYSKNEKSDVTGNVARMMVSLKK